MQQNLSNNSNYSYTETDGYDEFYLNIYFLDVILLLANIFALTANVIILYVMAKIKSWRTPVYALISSLALMDILRLLTSPGLLKWYKQVHDIYQDFTLQSVYLCLNLTFELGIISTLFILIYVGTIKLFKEHCLKIISTVWFMVVVLCIFAFAGIANDMFHFSMIFTFALHIFLTIVIIITCITFYVKKKHLDKEFKLRLTVTTVYVCFWLSFAFATIIMTIVPYDMILAKEIVLLIFAVGEMDAVVNVYLLMTMDRTFNIYFYRIFDCRRNNSDDKMNIVYEYQAGEEV